MASEVMEQWFDPASLVLGLSPPFPALCSEGNSRDHGPAQASVESQLCSY